MAEASPVADKQPGNRDRGSTGKELDSTKGLSELGIGFYPEPVERHLPGQCLDFSPLTLLSRASSRAMLDFGSTELREDTFLLLQSC